MLKNNKCVSLFVSLFILMSSGCSRDFITGKKSYNWFSPDEDIKLGQQVIGEQLAAFEKKHVPVDDAADTEMTQRIRMMTKRIGAISHYPVFPYEAHYAKVDIVNAWCAPGGKVMVYSGLFDPKKGLVRRDNPDELAAVLGHEISHATARHVTKSLSQNMTLMAVGQIAVSAIAASGGGVVQDAFNRAIVEGINLYVPAYSRKNEAEADRIGIMYAAKAGYNPQAAVDLWYRACHTRGNPFGLYDSHPPNCSRAKALEVLLPQAMAEYKKSNH